jgi:hypothetical protein
MPEKQASFQITPKIELDFVLDNERVAAIKQCLEKGKLTITLNKADLTTIVEGTVRSLDGYIYD